MTCASCAVDFLPTEEYVAGPDKNPYHAECLALAGQKPALKAVPSPMSPPRNVGKPEGVLVQRLANPLEPPRPAPGPDKPVPAPEPYDRFFPIVLDEKRRVIVPLNFTEDDLEFVFGVLDLYVKKRKKAQDAAQ